MRRRATPVNSAFRTIWLKFRSGKCAAGYPFSQAIASKTGWTEVRHASTASSRKRSGAGSQASERRIASLSILETLFQL